MKKYFISAAVLLSLSASYSLTSCEDMLAPESDLVMYEKDNQISTVNDTLYSVMGILSLVQQVADRTNLLGEVRGDLVTPTDDATIDIKELANFSVSEKNAYNSIKDYYAIINNCNYFIEHADLDFIKQGDRVFERELSVVHSFRAWAYLQLCMNYDQNGMIPFYTHFVGTQKEAELQMKEGWTKKEEIYRWLIEDLKPFEKIYPPRYGEIDKQQSKYFFIPVRLMLGELSLWAGGEENYRNAAKYFHDFITDENDYWRLYYYPAYAGWSTNVLPLYNNSMNFSLSTGEICFIPMEKSAVNGTVSKLNDIYNSTDDNFYHYQLTMSESAYERSEEQEYWYVMKEGTKRDTVCMNEVTWTDRRLNGDLRVYHQCTIHSYRTNNSKFNDSYQSVSGIYKDEVQLYTTPVVYLRYAEALNRAGFPTTALAVLKYGICEDNYIYMDSTIVNFDEMNAAGSLAYFDPIYFYNNTTSSDVESHYTIAGIHSRGCGDAGANPNYRIPALETKEDTTLFVEDLIMEELALETPFKGKRFYDLMRIAQRRHDNNYLAERVALRNGKLNKDEALAAKLQDSQNWYLPLQK